MDSKLDRLQEKVIELQLELRRLEARRRSLKRRIDLELNKLLRAKESTRKNRRLNL